MGGNAATVKAFDPARGYLFVLVCNPPADPNNDCTNHIASIDIAAAKVVDAPPIGIPTPHTPPLGAAFMMTLVWSPLTATTIV